MERSSAYRFTVTDRNDPRLLALKAEIRKTNRERREAGITARTLKVNLFGRAGRNNPRIDEAKGRSYAGPQYIPVAIAERWDVYVHERFDWKKAAPLPTPVLPPEKPLDQRLREACLDLKERYTIMARGRGMTDDEIEMMFVVEVGTVFNLDPAEGDEFGL